MRFVASVLLGVGLVASPASASTPENLIRNGSFEEGAFVGTQADLPWINFGVSRYTPGDGDDMMNYWSVNVGSVDLTNKDWIASDGTSSIDMVGLSYTAELSQSFSTVAGKTYLLSFDLAANPYAPAEAAQFMVLSVSVRSDLDSEPAVIDTYNPDPTGRTPENMGWERQELMFFATRTNYTLTFEGGSESCCWGPTIDNVSIIETIPLLPVSEPKFYSMFIAGVALMAFVARRRRRVC